VGKYKNILRYKLHQHHSNKDILYQGWPTMRPQHAMRLKKKFLRPKLSILENQRFFDILGLFLQVFVIMRPKKSIFLAKFSSCGPETILGWPPLFYTIIFALSTIAEVHSEGQKQ
jgi:hypothetical protein